MTVDLATYCCHKDKDKLYAHLEDHVLSHHYNFDNIHVIHQRVEPDYAKLGEEVNINCNMYVHEIKEEDYDSIFQSYNINPVNLEADNYTHGWNHSHYWRHHCVNHLTALQESEADYIVLCDADCHMVTKSDWVNVAINILKSQSNVLLVSPSDGSGQRLTQNMSQQLFICERERLKNIDFDLPFTGFRDGGPMQEYYFMLEGRIGRYMEKNNLYRYILNDRYRYWHKQWH